ncbi:MAG: matrixin, partial [Rubrivivax sp.]|nr:matrixin [Rubrivivax sp.]
AQLALDARLGFGHTHQQAVELMYTNLIGVAPSPQDSADLVALIDVYHVFTEASLAVFAAELPYNTANIDLVGLSQTGIEYVPA